MPTYINPDESSTDCTIPQQPPLIQHTVLTSLGVVTVRRREVKFDIKYLLFGAFQPTLSKINHMMSNEQGFIQSNSMAGIPMTESNNLIPFLNEIHRVLWDALDGLLSTAEAYYKTKGSRHITRPLDIKETFDKCADSINVRMNSYDRQTRQFHKDSLAEFHKQLDLNEKLMATLPEHFFTVYKKNIMYALGKELKTIHDLEFKTKWLELEGKDKIAIKNQLRPHLGHPGNADKLEILLMEESKRMEQVVTLVHEIHRITLSKLQEKLTEMLNNLTETSEYFLKAFDKIIVMSDCFTDEFYPEEQPRDETRYGMANRKQDADTFDSSNIKEEEGNTNSGNSSSKQSLGSGRMSQNRGRLSNMAKRRESHAAGTSPNRMSTLKNLNASNKTISTSNLLTHTKRSPLIKFGAASTGYNWSALRYLPSKDSVLESYTSKQISTKRQTMCHKMVINVRGRFLKEFTSCIHDLYVEADKNRDQRLDLIEKWNEEWIRDVERVRNLY